MMIFLFSVRVLLLGRVCTSRRRGGNKGKVDYRYPKVNVSQEGPCSY